MQRYNTENPVRQGLKIPQVGRNKKNLTPELLKEALSDDVLKTLIPKSLSQKYYYVRKLLY